MVSNRSSLLVNQKKTALAQGGALFFFILIAGYAHCYLIASHASCLLGGLLEITLMIIDVFINWLGGLLEITLMIIVFFTKWFGGLLEITCMIIDFFIIWFGGLPINYSYDY